MPPNMPASTGPHKNHHPTMASTGIATTKTTAIQKAIITSAPWPFGLTTAPPQCSPSRSQPRNRRQPDAVALRQFLQCSTFGAAAACLHLLRVGKLRGSPHVLPARLRSAPPFRRAGADQIALYVRQPPEDG